MDSSLDPCSKPIPVSEPPTLLLNLPLRRRLAHMRQGNILDPGLACQLLVGRRGDPSVAGQQARGPPELPTVVHQALGQAGLILPAALLQHREPRDDPPLDLVEADLPAELHRGTRLKAGDHLRVRLEQRDQLLARGDRIILQDAPHRLGDTLLQLRQDLTQAFSQPLRLRIMRVLAQSIDDPFALGTGPLRRGHEPAVGVLQCFASRLIPAAGDPVQLLRQLAHRPHPAAERLAHPRGGFTQGGPGPSQQPRDDPDAVADQAAVGGEMDVGLHRRGVDAELTAASNLERPGQLDDAIVELGDGPRPDGVGPADQRGVVGDTLEIDAAELAEDQAVVDEVFGLGVAPAVEPHDDEHAEDDLDGGGGSSSGAGLGITAGQVAADEVEQLVVIQEMIELLQLGLETEAKLGDKREQIGPVVSVLEHAYSLPEALDTAYFAPQTSATGVVALFSNRASCQDVSRIKEISHSSLTLDCHADVITDSCFSSDRRHVATCSRDGKTIIWDVSSGKEIRTIVQDLPISSIAFSIDGRYLAIGSCAEQFEVRQLGSSSISLLRVGGAIRLWDWEKLKMINNFDTLPQAPRHLAMSSNGSILSFVDGDYNLFTTDFPTLRIASTDKRTELKGQIGLFPTTRVSFGPDAKHAIAMRTEAITHRNGNRVYIAVVVCWDLVNNSFCVITNPNHDFSTSCVSFDGSTILVCTLTGSLFHYSFKGHLLKTVEHFTKSRADYITFDDSGKFIIVKTVDGIIAVKAYDSLNNIMSIAADRREAASVRSIVMGDKLLVLRGGFQYSKKVVSMDGAVKVLPEPLTLESYTFREKL